MNEEEFLQKIKGIKVNVPDEQFFLEYNAVVYNILKENQQLKEQLQANKKARKEAIETIKKHLEAKTYGNHKYELFGREYLEEILKILDIEKGE